MDVDPDIIALPALSNSSEYEYARRLASSRRANFNCFKLLALSLASLALCAIIDNTPGLNGNLFLAYTAVFSGVAGAVGGLGAVGGILGTWLDIRIFSKSVRKETQRIAELRDCGALSWRLSVLEKWRLIYRDGLMQDASMVEMFDRWRVGIRRDTSRRARAEVWVSSRDDMDNVVMLLEGSITAADLRIDDMISVTFNKHVTSEEERNALGLILAKGIGLLYDEIVKRSETEREQTYRLLAESRNTGLLLAGQLVLPGGNLTARNELNKLAANARSLEENDFADSAERLAGLIAAHTTLNAATAGFLDHILPRSTAILSELSRLHGMPARSCLEERNIAECRDAIAHAGAWMNDHATSLRREKALETSFSALSLASAVSS